MRRARPLDMVSETTAVPEHNAAHGARLGLGAGDMCLGRVVVEGRLEMRGVVTSGAAECCRCQAQLWVGLTVTLANAVRCVLMVAQVGTGLESRVAPGALPVSMSAGTTAKQRTSAAHVNDVDMVAASLPGYKDPGEPDLLAGVVFDQPSHYYNLTALGVVDSYVSPKLLELLVRLGARAPFAREWPVAMDSGVALEFRLVQELGAARTLPLCK